MKTNFTKMFLTLAVALCTVAAGAHDIGTTTPSGNAGDVTATLDNGVLTITKVNGTGATALPTGTTELNAWKSDLANVNTIVVEAGVTSLADELFDGASGIKTVYLLNSTAVTLGTDVFDASVSDVTIVGAVSYSTENGWKDLNNTVFTLKQGYTLTVTVLGSGNYGYTANSKPLYSDGETVKIKAEADDDHEFVKWSDGSADITDVETEITFSTANISYTLTFLETLKAAYFEVTTADLIVEWSGSAQGVTVAAIGSSGVTIDGTTGTMTIYYGESDVEPTKVGSYPISVAFAGGTKYAPTKVNLPLEKTFEITKKTPEFGDLSVIYDGGSAETGVLAKTPTWTGNAFLVDVSPKAGLTPGQMDEPIKVKYYVDYAAKEVVSAPVNIGTYAVYAVVSGPCFKSEEVELGTITIGAATLPKAAFVLEFENEVWTGAAKNIPWNGEPHPVTVTPAPAVSKDAIGDFKVQYQLTGGSSLSDEIPVDANTTAYEVYVVTEGGTGYGATGLKVGEFTITLLSPTLTEADFDFSPKEAEYVANKKQGVSVTPKASSGVIAAGLGDSTITYSPVAGGGADIISTRNTPDGPTEVGEYTVKVEYAAGSGYDAITTPLELGKFVIGNVLKESDLKYTAFDGSEYKWNGSPQGKVEVAKKTGVDGGAVTVSYYDNATKKTSSDVPVNAGTYTVIANTAAAPGYVSKDIELGSFRIVGKTPTVADLNVTGIGSFEYNGDKREVTVSGKSEGLGKVTNLKYGDKTEAPTEPGEYLITVDIAQGTAYEAAPGFRVGTLTITQSTNPPTITRQVELPAVPAGITLSKPVGKNPVKSSSNFTFTIKGAKAEPVVNSSGGNNVDVKPNGSDYDVTVYGVVSDISLTIDIPTGNAAIEGTQIWSSGGRLYIASSQSGEARIYNLTGAQVKALVLSAGETVSEPLATGLYIVTLNGKTQKIHIH